MATRISKLAAAGTLTGAEQVEVTQLSTTVTVTAATISALASDNSFNDSGAGFVTAGFAVGQTVRVTGFTGNVANNIYSAKITALTTGKMTIGGTDGDVIVDDAAGESVTITKWDSKRGAYGVGVSDAADVEYTPGVGGDWTPDPDDAAEALDQLAARVSDVELATGNVSAYVTFPVAVGDETTALTTGTAKVTFRVPYAMSNVTVRASVTTAPTGANLVVDINENTGGGATSILSTKLSIDAGEKTSTTAAAPPVVSDASLANDSEITIDIDQVGSTIAGAGLKVYITGTIAAQNSINGGYIGVKGADIASASTADLATATGDWVDITGTTTITALGTVTVGVERLVRFTGILTLTHNGTSLILPTAANITTAAGDFARFRSLGSGNWVCVSYQRKDGTALAGSGGTNIYDAAWFDVTAYGATGDGSTDDRDAIQDAIDAAEAAGGGTVYFPRGTYVVNGALQDTSRSNAQILLPIRDYADTEAITISMVGETGPSAVVSVIGATPIQNNLSIIKGTLNSGTGALMGAHGPSGTFDDFSNVLVKMRDLTVQMPSNPTLTALDFSRVAQLDVDGLVIHTGTFDVTAVTEATTATSFGLRTPGNQNGAMTRLGIVNVVGFYKGYEIGEHCFGQYPVAWACKQAFVFVAANHSSAFVRPMAVHCQRGLVFTGGAHYTSIQEFNIEHASSGTWTPVYDIDDASHYGRGHVAWHVVLGGTGPDVTFLVNGGNNIRRTILTPQRVTTLTDGATINTDCNVADNFRVTLGGNRTLANPTNLQDGRVYNWRVIQDGTGSRTLAYGSKFKFPGGAPTLTTTASAKDFISCQYDVTDDTLFCAIAKAMA
ncbi:MAG: glycosyl hydrolase family 28-related protein [Pseudomonadota bacterium]